MCQDGALDVKVILCGRVLGGLTGDRFFGGGFQFVAAVRN